MNKSTFDFQNRKLTAVAVTSTAGTLIAVSPAYSQTSVPQVADISATVTSVGTVAAGAVAIVLGVMGLRLGIKVINRLTVKG